MKILIILSLIINIANGAVTPSCKSRSIKIKAQKRNLKTLSNLYKIQERFKNALQLRNIILLNENSAEVMNSKQKEIVQLATMISKLGYSPNVISALDNENSNINNLEEIDIQLEKIEDKQKSKDQGYLEAIRDNSIVKSSAVSLGALVLASASWIALNSDTKQYSLIRRLRLHFKPEFKNIPRQFVNITFLGVAVVFGFNIVEGIELNTKIKKIVQAIKILDKMEDKSDEIMELDEQVEQANINLKFYEDKLKRIGLLKEINGEKFCKGD